MAEYDNSSDLVSRGQYGSSPLGSTIFVGLRVLDGFVLQRALQVLNPMPALWTRLGWEAPPPPPTGGLPLAMSAHDLTPFQAVLWSMAIATALKHSFWLLFTSKEKVKPGAAVVIGVFNTVMNSLNTLAFAFAAVNPTWSESNLYISIPIFAAGILIETISEVQRKQFKDDRKNDGKLYTGGLFGYARSINYFGYMLWRAAFATAGGGLILGGIVAAWHTFDFCGRAIPTMDDYCSKKYGAQWTEAKKKVPYAFFPGVY